VTYLRPLHEAEGHALLFSDELVRLHLLVLLQLGALELLVVLGRVLAKHVKREAVGET
jgi:hypothetical protein